MLEMRVEAAIIHRLILDSPSSSTHPSRNPTSSSASTHSSINPNLNTSILSVHPASQLDDTKRSMHKELKAWLKLVDPRYIERTKIGVLIMVFQRMFLLLFRPHLQLNKPYS